jgi:hypothetical protein
VVYLPTYVVPDVLLFVNTDDTMTGIYIYVCMDIHVWDRCGVHLC